MQTATANLLLTLTKLCPIGYNLNMTEHYRLISTQDFREWQNEEPPRSQYQIDARLAKIRLEGYFGNHKSVSHEEKETLKDQIWELKFNDGRRIYYAYIPEKKILLLLGGNKNGQDRDIKKAKSIFVKKTHLKG
jgi:putative addiction module killer protein